MVFTEVRAVASRIVVTIAENAQEVKKKKVAACPDTAITRRRAINVIFRPSSTSHVFHTIPPGPFESQTVEKTTHRFLVYFRTSFSILVLLLNAQPTDDASRSTGEFSPTSSWTPFPPSFSFPWVPGNHSIAHLRASSSAFTGWYHTGRFTCVLSL